jgi:hypothetical protein
MKFSLSLRTLGLSLSTFARSNSRATGSSRLVEIGFGDFEDL